MNHPSLKKAICGIDRHKRNLCQYDMHWRFLILDIFLKIKFKELLYEALYYIELHFLYNLLFYLKCSFPFQI